MAAALALGMPGMALAGVTRIIIERTRPAPPAAGAADCEIVSGTFEGELDPASPHNRLITDIARAGRAACRRHEHAALGRADREGDDRAQGRHGADIHPADPGHALRHCLGVCCGSDYRPG